MDYTLHTAKWSFWFLLFQLFFYCGRMLQWQVIFFQILNIFHPFHSNQTDSLNKVLRLSMHALCDQNPPIPVNRRITRSDVDRFLGILLKYFLNSFLFRLFGLISFCSGSLLLRWLTTRSSNRYPRYHYCDLNYPPTYRDAYRFSEVFDWCV